MNVNEKKTQDHLIPSKNNFKKQFIDMEENRYDNQNKQEHYKYDYMDNQQNYLCNYDYDPPNQGHEKYEKYNQYHTYKPPSDYRNIYPSSYKSQNKDFAYCKDL